MHHVTTPKLAAVTGAPGNVDLWLLYDESGTGDLGEDFLSTAERQRAVRYRSPEKMRQFLFARTLGRLVFARYLDCQPEEVTWTASGPPTVCRLDDASPLSVSVSHSGRALAIAIAPAGAGIGVDIEETSATLNVSALAHVALTPREQAQFNALEPSAQDTFVRRIWTAKEAALKSLRQNRLPSPQELHVDAIDGVIHARSRNGQIERMIPTWSFAASVSIRETSIGECLKSPSTIGDVTLSGALAVASDDPSPCARRESPSKWNLQARESEFAVEIRKMRQRNVLATVLGYKQECRIVNGASGPTQIR